MNVFNVNIQQVQPIERLIAHVLITFDIAGGVDPNGVVEIYARGASDLEAHRIDTVILNQGMRLGYSILVDVEAGAVYYFTLCPRTVTGGTLDQEVNGEDWQEACTEETPFITKALEQPSGGGNPATPTFTLIQPRQFTLHDEARILIQWLASGCDKYHFMWTDFDPPPIQAGQWNGPEIGNPWFTIQPAQPGRKYTFKVQGCKSNLFFPDACSSYTADTSIVMPPNTRSLRLFLQLSNVRSDLGMRQIGQPLTGGVRAMMQI